MNDDKALAYKGIKELETNSSPAQTQHVIVTDANTGEPKKSLLSSIITLISGLITAIKDSNGNEVMTFTAGSTAAGREINVVNNSTSASPYLRPANAGSTGDVNIGMDIKSVGTGINKLIGNDANVIGWQKDTSAKLGFFDKSTAPVVQATKVADASTSVAVSGSTALSSTALAYSSTEISGAINNLGVTVNAILSALQTNGLMASST